MKKANWPYIYIAAGTKPCNSSILALARNMPTCCYIQFYIGYTLNSPAEYKTSSSVRDKNKWSCMMLLAIAEFACKSSAISAEIDLLKQCKAQGCWPELINKAICRHVDWTGRKRSKSSVDKTNRANTGKKHSAEHRARISESRKGKSYARRRGYKSLRTQEHNAKIAAALHGVPFTDIRKANISAGLTGKKHSAEHRQANREAQIKRYIMALQNYFIWPVAVQNKTCCVKLYSGADLNDFIIEHSLTRKHIVSVLKENRNSHNGWRYCDIIKETR